MKQKKFTPDIIETLEPNQIFVFGSNLNGHHTGGAARTAVEKFGAINGQAEGLQGQSYAIPTLGKKMEKLPLNDIYHSLITLWKFAKAHPDKEFLVTKIGCGIAGFNIGSIVYIFRCLPFQPANIILPYEFVYRLYTIPASRAFQADFELYIKDTFEDEIADAIIRLLDLSAYLNIDIDKHMELKMKYNSMRTEFDDISF